MEEQAGREIQETPVGLRTVWVQTLARLVQQVETDQLVHQMPEQEVVW
jgi:hypothetical protein